MTNFELWALLILAACIHASFQLSVSMLTLLHGHARGKRAITSRLLRLNLGFVIGAATMIALLLAFFGFVMNNLFEGVVPPIVLAAICGLTIGVGVAVWVFYYRYRSRGTVLWLPRSFADYLASRTQKTDYAVESFGLGMVSVIAEFLFGFAPLIISAYIILQFNTPTQLLALLTYTVIAMAPLMVVTMLLGGGHSLARIQKWRENNKRFMQFAAGSALVVLGIYLYVSTILAQASVIRGFSL